MKWSRKSKLHKLLFISGTKNVGLQYNVFRNCNLWYLIKPPFHFRLLFFCFSRAVPQKLPPKNLKAVEVKYIITLPYNQRPKETIKWNEWIRTKLKYRQDIMIMYESISLFLYLVNWANRTLKLSLYPLNIIFKGHKKLCL